ncbi:MFS transporter [Serratia quinivorans]|uniref:MFS transporter n=1 Tax=Serratia quinivorans TaxID=137545 RepID=UPI00217A8477|nr:MFS transporter [Serratia quinivorans]CAI0830240.1 MFS transport protein AraJ [Serratia quinivorans]CAI0833082.1 MFS transport protein AraJ [Serratia quinivorans]CAI0856014.1 MFS transport protein AraJ [Serratia quinivorans]CAI1498663.1 MFS transport protein AraJ [Serratia quinivorans]CAI2040247.1 MFS transport protein AraJ [Serratia quinivorans]
MPLAVYILGLAIFSIGTAELMVAGMMSTLSAAFGITVGEVGHLISYYAFGVMLGGPVLTYFFLKFKAPYRTTLLWLLALYVAVQGLSAFVSDYSILVAIRIVTGVLCAGCLSLALATSMALVPIQHRPRAASIVIGGFMVSNVFGVPLATIIDQHWGWRITFGLVAVLVLICLLALARLLPAIAAGGTLKMAEELKAFKNNAYWKACATSCLILGASFAAFSYFVPVLVDVSGFSMQTVPFILMLYGLANIAGNMVTGRLAYRHSLAIMVVGLTILSLSLLGMALFAEYQLIAIFAVILIGLSGVPMNPAMMARIVTVAHPGPMVNAVHTSVINIGLGGGSYLGGMAIASGYGLRSALWIGMVLAILALASVLPYLRRGKQGWN